MSSSLISIASSGLSAARAALDVTSQNIANASTDGYVRRSVNLSALTSPGLGYTSGVVSQLGVRVTGITRDADTFLQSEVYRTGSDAARADAQVTGLTNISNAVEQSGVYTSITSFLSSMQQLQATPTDTSLRASMLESANSMAQSFNLASTTLGSAMSGLQSDASGGVTQVNQLATSLAALNTQIAADNDPASNNAGLLDSRDQILTKLSSYGDLKITYNTNNTVQVQMGGTSGPVLVNGNTASNLAMTTASNGTVSYTVGGSALTLSGGSLAGDQQALITGAGGQSQLDSIASTLISTVNTAQTNGTDLTGTAGVAMFSGTSAGTMTIALTSGSQIAAAKSGSAANSQDATNLTSMQSAISSAGTSNSTNQLIFSLSSAVSGATTTQTALDTISSNAKTSLASQAGVSLDTEATNLIQYQQAYQASGKVIQVAQTLFDQLLNI